MGIEKLFGKMVVVTVKDVRQHKEKYLTGKVKDVKSETNNVLYLENDTSSGSAQVSQAIPYFGRFECIVSIKLGEVEIYVAKPNPILITYNDYKNRKGISEEKRSRIERECFGEFLVSD